jgi:hypothetical protein
MAEDTTEGTPSEQEQTSGNPWDQDLAGTFEDEAVRSQVSDFLGEHVQPYVTRLEQESRPNRDAARLWEGFAETPVQTYVQVSRELFGDEVADRVAATLQGEEPTPTPAPDTQTEGDEQTTAPETPADDGDIPFEKLPANVQEAVAKQEAEEQRTAYYNEVERVTKEHADDLPKDAEGNPQLNVDLFHPFVVAADGDFDQAYDQYAQFYATARQEWGGEPQAETPPPAIDSTTRDAAATPPQEVKYGSLDEAMDAFFDEQKSPPPTVGAA